MYILKQAHRCPINALPNSVAADVEGRCTGTSIRPRAGLHQAAEGCCQPAIQELHTSWHRPAVCKCSSSTHSSCHGCLVSCYRGTFAALNTPCCCISDIMKHEWPCKAQGNECCCQLGMTFCEPWLHVPRAYQSMLWVPTDHFTLQVTKLPGIQSCRESSSLPSDKDWLLSSTLWQPDQQGTV